MSITISTKTKYRASLKLLNQIATYIFEQQYDELKGETELINSLKEVYKQLAKKIKEKQQESQ